MIGSPPNVSQPLGKQTSSTSQLQLASLSLGQEKHSPLVTQAAPPPVPPVPLEPALPPLPP
ncbi:MAG: hypothetical protein WBM76_06505, partial [Woeseiaceae bacterium]